MMQVQRKTRLGGKFAARKMASFTVAAFLFAAGACDSALAASTLPQRWQLNMPEGVTQTSHDAYFLHMLAFWICVVIGIIVFGAMFIAMFRDRKSRGAVAATWSHNTKAEIIWTVVPILILIAMAAPATSVLINEAYTDESQMTIKVTGYQWKWGYDYVNWGDKAYHVHFISRLDGDSDRTRQLKSGLDPNAVEDSDGEHTYLLNVDHPLVLPTKTKVRFVVTGDDVIHAWWVPTLGWKQDAIPGIINDDLDQYQRARHLSRPVRGTVRPGSRLHADRRQGGAEGRIQVARSAGSCGYCRRQRPPRRPLRRRHTVLPRRRTAERKMTAAF